VSQKRVVQEPKLYIVKKERKKEKRIERIGNKVKYEDRKKERKYFVLANFKILLTFC
jgi:hypothetical protein